MQLNFMQLLELLGVVGSMLGKLVLSIEAKKLLLSVSPHNTVFIICNC